jgi:hypothetical protein
LTLSHVLSVSITVQIITVQGGVQSPLHTFLHEEGGDEGGCSALTVRRGALPGEQRHLVFEIQTTVQQNHKISPGLFQIVRELYVKGSG